MTAFVICCVYVVIGCGAAIAVVVQRRPIGPLRGAPAAVAVFVLWPFLLPASFADNDVQASPPSVASSPRSARVDELAAVLHAAWADAVTTDDNRERVMLEQFVSRLKASERRLDDLDRAIDSSHERVKGKLQLMRTNVENDVERGIGLLEDISAQLTLLKFADCADPGTASDERERIEDLLMRIEALAEAA